MEESIQGYLNNNENNWNHFNTYMLGCILSEYFKEYTTLSKNNDSY